MYFILHTRALKEKEAELNSIRRQEQTQEGALLRLETDLATVSHKAEEYCNTISELSEVIFKLKKENKVSTYEAYMIYIYIHT